MDTNQAIREYLEFQIKREVTTLYKNFLQIVENIRDERYTISNSTFDFIRKRVLDDGNSASRNLIGHLDKVDVKLKL